MGRIGNALALLSLVALVAACGGSSGTGGTGGGAKGPQNALAACPKSTNSSAASAESGTITLNVTGWSSTTAEDALVKQGFDNFTKKYPNIKVNWTPIPDAYDTKMRANVASGSVADVFYVQPSMAQEYIPSGKLLNLSPYMARDQVAATDFYDSLLKPFTCADGTIYGLPKDWNALGLFYNKTMFQQAGVGAPTDWSWSDMQSAAQKLTKQGANAASTVYGISTSADASRWLAFLFADGGKALSSDGKKSAFNDSTAVQAMDFYTSFRKNNTGAMPKDIGAGWNGEAFGKKQAAMALEGGWLIPYLASTYPDVKYGIAPLPKAPNGQRGNLLFTNAWGAYAQTSHPDAAWKLVQYMTSAEYQQLVLRNGFALPTIKSLTNASYFGQNPGFKTLLDGAQYGTADYFGAADKKVHDEIANALEAVMLGRATSADALNTAAQNVNTFIQQNLPPS